MHTTVTTASRRPFARASALTGLLIAGALTGCTVDDPSDATGLSWECVRVKTAVDLTSSMTVGEARGLLRDAKVDPAWTADEKGYVQALLGGLRGVDDTETLGERLDTVPCTL